jgi:hypothetical protein
MPLLLFVQLLLVELALKGRRLVLVKAAAVRAAEAACAARFERKKTAAAREGTTRAATVRPAEPACLACSERRLLLV